jgi:alpha-L-rhamnosidase
MVHRIALACEVRREVDLAFDLLNQDTPPSWLYQVKRGATTIWESWDAIRPNGSLSKGMSFNHYAFGAIGDWLYRYVAGIGPDARQPGFKHVLLAPHPGGGLSEARAQHRSPYGEIALAWRIEGDAMQVEARIPPNSTAALRLPGARAGEVAEGGLPVERAQGLSGFQDRDGGMSLQLGSGSYVFRYPYAER